MAADPAAEGLLVANWKMNPPSAAEAAEIATAIAAAAAQHQRVGVAVCPPFTWLGPVAERLRGSTVAIGAQDCFWEDSGAYTGEISPRMLAGWCRWVIVGHSERRHLLGETDEQVARKAEAARGAGLDVIVCVGELEDQFTAGNTRDVVSNQVRRALAGLAADDARHLAIAYEPVWAIGTGRSADPEHAYHTMRQVRRVIAECIGEGAAALARVLYGGSVTAANVESFVELPHCDGCLVGGASLKADEFGRMIEVTDAVFRGGGGS